MAFQRLKYCMKRACVSLPMLAHSILAKSGPLITFLRRAHVIYRLPDEANDDGRSGGETAEARFDLVSSRFGLDKSKATVLAGAAGIHYRARARSERNHSIPQWHSRGT